MSLVSNENAEVKLSLKECASSLLLYAFMTLLMFVLGPVVWLLNWYAGLWLIGQPPTILMPALSEWWEYAWMTGFFLLLLLASAFFAWWLLLALHGIFSVIFLGKDPGHFDSPDQESKE